MINKWRTFKIDGGGEGVKGQVSDRGEISNHGISLKPLRGILIIESCSIKLYINQSTLSTYSPCVDLNTLSHKVPSFAPAHPTTMALTSLFSLSLNKQYIYRILYLSSLLQNTSSSSSSSSFEGRHYPTQKYYLNSDL